MSRALLVLAAAAMLLSRPVHADPVSLPRTSEHIVEAKANGVRYKLYVSLPRGYEEGKERYPVIYLLDADYSFAIARNVVEHLADRDHLRWAIVVGIAYAGEDAYRLNRTRDYTPKFAPAGGYGPQYQKHSGGGPKFRTFLKDELLPFVDGRWRTTAERVLVGHSYGGLFASWNLLSLPRLFDGYIIVSPSLWYDDRSLLRQAVPKTLPAARVYLTVGALESDGRAMQNDLHRLARILSGRPGIAVRHEVLPDETHNSVFPSAFSRGIRFVLQGR